MSMGTRRRRWRQGDHWITHAKLVTAPPHPISQRLSALLSAEKLDQFAEKECLEFYAENNGRPSGICTPGSNV